MTKHAAPKWIGTVAAATIAMMIFARPALAHGRLKFSTPPAGAHLAIAPREIRLDFSEVPELAFMRIELIDPSGKVVRLSIPVFAADSRRGIVATIQGGLIAGGYTVVWQMGGADGHIVRDRYAFVIAPGAMGIGVAGSTEQPTSRAESAGMASEHHDPTAFPSGNGFGSESLLYVLIRWSTFTGLLLAIGAISFNQIVLRRMSNASHLRDPMYTTASRRTVRFGLHAAYAVFISSVLRLAAQSQSMHGTRDMANPYLIRTMIVGTLWGRGWLAQMFATMIAVFAFHQAARAEPGTSAARRGWIGATIAVVLLAFTPALAGHAAAVSTLGPLPVIADGLHILGAGGWLGSLAMVVLVGIPAALSQNSEQRGPIVANLINAFSPVGLACAGLVAATGVFAAWLHLGSIPALWQSRYGQILLIKLFVLSAVAITGAYNWLRVKPSLGKYEGAVRIRRSARIELAIGIAVLLITAILVATPTAMDMKM